MYSTLDSGDPRQPSGLSRLARRDLPSTPRVPGQSIPTNEAARWPALTLDATLRWARGGVVWIIVLAAAGAAAGYGYSILAKPKFTASTDLIVDPGNLQLVKTDLYPAAYDQNAQLLDAESKLRVVTSGNVLKRVVEQMNLQNDPEFQQAHSGFDFLSGAAPAATSLDPVETAIDALDKDVSAWREERSFVVTVSVSTSDGDKSAHIADAIVTAFQSELAAANSEGASRASAALDSRLADLQNAVNLSEEAVETFKAAHNLQESDGELVSTQSMAQLNKTAVDAQQTLISAQSLYSELTDPKTGAANAEAVQTPTMVALRTQYGLVKQAADAAATTFGPLHPARASAERQLSGLQAQITAEANRAVQAAKLALDQAKRNVAALDQQTDTARTTVVGDDQAQVQLRELERDAKAKGDVYDAYLTRSHEIAEQQQLDTTNIRVISPAMPPSTRSWPPRGIVVAGMGGGIGGALGLVLALGLGFLVDTRRLRKP